MTLPGDVRDRYGMTLESAVRLVETRTGLLLVPLTDEPMGKALTQELAQWRETDCGLRGVVGVRW